MQKELNTILSPFLSEKAPLPPDISSPYLKNHEKLTLLDKTILDESPLNLFNNDSEKYSVSSLIDKEENCNNEHQSSKDDDLTTKDKTRHKKRSKRRKKQYISDSSSEYSNDSSTDKSKDKKRHKKKYVSDDDSSTDKSKDKKRHKKKYVSDDDSSSDKSKDKKRRKKKYISDDDSSSDKKYKKKKSKRSKKKKSKRNKKALIVKDIKSVNYVKADNYIKSLSRSKKYDLDMDLNNKLFELYNSEEKYSMKRLESLSLHDKVIRWYTHERNVEIQKLVAKYKFGVAICIFVIQFIVYKLGMESFDFVTMQISSIGSYDKYLFKLVEKKVPNMIPSIQTDDDDDDNDNIISEILYNWAYGLALVFILFLVDKFSDKLPLLGPFKPMIRKYIKNIGEELMCPEPSNKIQNGNESTLDNVLGLIGNFTGGSNTESTSSSKTIKNDSPKISIKNVDEDAKEAEDIW